MRGSFCFFDPMKLLSSVTFTSNNNLNYLKQKDIKYKLKKEGQQKTHRQLAFRSLKDTKKTNITESYLKFHTLLKIMSSEFSYSPKVSYETNLATIQRCL